MTDNSVENALNVLQSTPQTMCAILSSLSRELAEQPADGDWSPRDVLAHLTASEERGSMSRIRAMIEADRPLLPNLDENEELTRSGLRSWDVEALLQEFASRRTANMTWLRGMDEVALSRVGEHSAVGLITAGEVLYHAAYHDCLHVRQVLTMVSGHFDPLRGPLRVF